jgi:hypothetical protein
MKIKIDRADTLFSWYIRERDGWRCVCCDTQYRRKEQGLQNSHYWSRGNEGTRFDPDNCDALCFGCHRKWGGDDREKYKEFKLGQLGEERYKVLDIKAHSYSKKDRKMALIVAKAQLIDLLTGRSLTMEECGYK